MPVVDNSVIYFRKCIDLLLSFAVNSNDLVMRKTVIILIVAVLGVSCSKRALQRSDNETATLPAQEKVAEELPIVEKEEKLVEVEKEPPVSNLYYVIIGSFKSRENAVNYQAELKEKGFESNLLRNEEGFYRVSVKSTNEILDARSEIMSIRINYPEHADTWLLIRKK
jgi:cell division protein FtsN